MNCHFNFKKLSMHSKAEFITDLIKNKSLKPSHKERLLVLLASEIKKLSPIKENNNNRKKTVEILRLFDSKLKYFTHKWEDSISAFQREEEIKKALGILYTFNGQIPDTLYQRILYFIDKNPKKKNNEEFEWFVNPLFGKPFYAEYSWNNTKFVHWFNNSISKDITAEEINQKMIEPFKHSIQIRDGRLREHIKPIVDQTLNTEFEIEYLNLEQAKFYIDVQNLMVGLKILLKESILKFAKKYDRYYLRIEYRDSDRTLRIVHIKSNCELNADNPDFIGGSFKSVMAKFRKVCNWSVEASFANGNKRLNLLTDENLPSCEELDYTPEGFTHILYFC